MTVMFTCQTCGSPVEYDLVTVETHQLRQYGVHHYECSEPCATCVAPESPSDMIMLETAQVA